MKLSERIRKAEILDARGQWWGTYEITTKELKEVAKLEEETEALRQLQHDSQRLLNAVVCSPVYHKVKDAYKDLRRAVEILTGDTDD